MEASVAERRGQRQTPLRDEVEKRYLAYALSTIVARALPDVRDGLKPVHRRILYAMHTMGLSDAARMRKSAAVVGEVIGKYHPHGDQAAYDALVRMAQDFSLRYPLISGSGNFGSVDGDAPAAMRYTETRLSPFAGILLREIDQGTTDFRPTYDAMGVEPLVLPAGVPNLLVNGSSGIAVGMSCSFPPHNLNEVVAACRAAIRDQKLDSAGLLRYVTGPDFPTRGEIIDQAGMLAQIYASGHGSVQLRGTFEVEEQKRGRKVLVITSIPYSVNKSRLIERIAHLVRDKRLKQVLDVRDESTHDVRIVLELRSSDVTPASVMAFLYRHTDMQINFPVNMIAITPQGVPERLSLERIIRHFLQFRYEKTTLRLQYRLGLLQKRIHVLEGFADLFSDLDRALNIIRSARNRKAAEDSLRAAFSLDDEQVDAVLEMRLYRLVALEKDKLLGELKSRLKDAEEIAHDLDSPQRLWKIVDKELEEIVVKYGDARRTALVQHEDAAAIEYRPDDFVEHEDVTVILSRQGWLRRVKMEVEDASSVKFREGDGPFGVYRVHTDRTVAFITNLGKVYVMRVLDVPPSSGFGEPLGSLINLVDGEHVVGFIAPEPVMERASGKTGRNGYVQQPSATTEDLPEPVQPNLFGDLEVTTPQEPDVTRTGPCRGLVVTRLGKGFRFDYEQLREPTKRIGRKLVNLAAGDEVATVMPEDATLVVLGADSGKVLVFPIDQIPVLAGPGQGVRLIRLASGSRVVFSGIVGPESAIRVYPKKGREKTIRVAEIPRANRATQGRKLAAGMKQIELVKDAEADIQ